MKKNTVDSAMLAQIINDVWDGVDRSKVGVFYHHDDDGNLRKDANGFPYINTVAFQTFLTVLAQVIPKEMEIQ